MGPAAANLLYFHHVATLGVRFPPYGELGKHREAIARFGEGMKAILAVSRTIE